MSFFSQLMDEVHDRNIAEPETEKEPAEEETNAESAEYAETQAEPEPEVEEAEEVDPEYPDHPDYIALRPNLTERTLWRLPALRFYCTLVCFGIGMVLFGIINVGLGLDMTKGAVGWYQLFGAAIGFLISREVLEPRLKIPFSAGTPEQKQKAVDAYLAEIKALDEQIEAVRKMNGTSDSDE